MLLKSIVDHNLEITCRIQWIIYPVQGRFTSEELTATDYTSNTIPFWRCQPYFRPRYMYIRMCYIEIAELLWELPYLIKLKIFKLYHLQIANQTSKMYTLSMNKLNLSNPTPSPTVVPSWCNVYLDIIMYSPSLFMWLAQRQPLARILKSSLLG